MKSASLTLLFNLLLVFSCFAQTKRIDSLKRQLHIQKDRPAQLNKLLELCEEFETLPKDTLWHYALQAKSLAAELKDTKAYTLAALAQYNAYMRWNNTDSASAVIKPELAKYTAEDPNTRSLYFRLMRAQIDLLNDNSYKDAMTKTYSVLHEAELYKDSLAVAECMNTIGALEYDMSDDVNPARQWLFKALKYTTDAPKFMKIKATILIDLTDNYWWIGKQDSAMYYIEKAGRISQAMQNLYYLSCVAQKRAAIYNKTGKYKDAGREISQSIALDRITDGKELRLEKLIVLATVYEQLKQYDKGIKVLNDALLADSLYRISGGHQGKKTNAIDLQRIFCYEELAKCYQLKGDNKNYEATLEKIIRGQDVFYKTNSEAEITELETKYKTQEKESTIARQKIELEKENYLFFGSLLVMLLIMVILWLIFRGYRRKQRLLAANAISEAEETERKRIAADLHDNLGSQLSFIKRNVEFLIERPTNFKPADERRYLDNLNEIAKSAMIDLRETIWVLNKEEVFVQEFADKLKFYLRQQLASWDTAQWEIIEKIETSWQLSSTEAMHLFRITQELVNNIIKHSGADHITVEFSSLSPNAYQLCVSDNGSGFDLKQARKGHYGLNIIRQRAKDLKAGLSVESNERGTRITLTKL